MDAMPDALSEVLKGPGDVVAQAEQAMDNVAVLLGEAGAKPPRDFRNRARQVDDEWWRCPRQCSRMTPDRLGRLRRGGLVAVVASPDRQA